MPAPHTAGRGQRRQQDLAAIDSGHFADELYSAGRFTYIYNYGNPTAPQFEVVNHWVTR